jgi:hypothetical protein
MALTQETRNVKGFTEVALRGYGTLVVEQDPTAAGQGTLTIEADDILMPRIEAEVQGGRLVLGIRMPWYEWMSFGINWLFLPHKGIRYHLRTAEISGLSIGGAGRVSCAPLRTDTCRLSIGGSGVVVIDKLEARDVEAEIGGSGRIECTGSAGTLRARVSGSGRVKADELSVRNADVSITGSGRVSLRAGETLDVRVSGSGLVEYRGNPVVSSRVSGSGRIRHRD